MRATRAYIASLGTTGLLLASAGSLLLVVSALFAFKAWPGSQITDAVDSVAVDEDDRPFRVSGPEQVALDAAAVAVAADGTGGGAGGGTTDGSRGGTGPNDGSGGGFQNTGGGTGGGAPPTGTSGDGVGDVPDTVDPTEVTDNLADSTEEATRGLGNSLGDANPDLGDAVTNTGGALSDIVRDLPDVDAGSDGVKLGDRTLLGQ